MNINIRLKEDDFLCVVGHQYKEDIVRIEVYGYDEQENQILFDLSIEQAKDLKKQLNREELDG